MSKVVIAVTGFTENLRSDMIYLIISVGAKYTPWLSRENTHLICLDPHGPKFEKAKEWGLKVINKNWIEDCVREWKHLSEEEPRYQNWQVLQSEVPMRADLLFSSTADDEEEGEKQEKRKKRKSQDQASSSSSSSTSSSSFASSSASSTSLSTTKTKKKKRIFMLSGLPPSDLNHYQQIIEKLGATCHSETNFNPECTHLVVKDLKRTEKVLCALASGCWLLDIEYLDASLRARAFVEEEKYEIGGGIVQTSDGKILSRDAAKRWRLKISSSNQQKAAFNGFNIAIHPGSVKKNVAELIERLVTVGQGSIVPFAKAKNFFSSHPHERALFLIIANKRDSSLPTDPHIRVVNSDFILDFLSHENEPNIANYILK